MEFGSRVTGTILFPKGGIDDETSTDGCVEFPSFEIQTASGFEDQIVNLLDDNSSVESSWEVDGGEADGRLFWMTPKFARYKRPMWIDVHLRSLITDPPTLARLLDVPKIPMVTGTARGRLGIARYILRVLDHWSSTITDFETRYMSAPLGSQIVLDAVKSDICSVSVKLNATYELERQWLPAQELHRIWNPCTHSVPDSIDIDQLVFTRRLAYSICIVQIVGRPALGDLVFKVHMPDATNMYRELRNLMALPDHPNLQRKPLYIVTKRVSFGGKHGVCGYLTENYPTGSLRHLISRVGRDMPQRSMLELAADIAKGLIQVRDSPLGYYAGLKPDNIVIESTGGQTPGGNRYRAILIDFEQGTPWYLWAPPEVYWINMIERLAKSDDSVVVIPPEYLSLLRSLVPGWSPRFRWAKYDSDAAIRVPPSWAHLNHAEKNSAVVYMLGKVLWCMMEGVAHMAEPATFDSFLADPTLPIFPEFRRTPPALRRWIRRCTSGAPEWRDRGQPFHVRRGIVRLKEVSDVEQVLPGEEQLVEVAACEWWSRELEAAKSFIEMRSRTGDSAGRRSLADFMSVRPTLEDVLRAIQDAQESSS